MFENVVSVAFQVYASRSGAKLSTCIRHQKFSELRSQPLRYHTVIYIYIFLFLTYPLVAVDDRNSSVSEVEYVFFAVFNKTAGFQVTIARCHILLSPWAVVIRGSAEEQPLTNGEVKVRFTILF